MDAAGKPSPFWAKTHQAGKASVLAGDPRGQELGLRKWTLQGTAGCAGAVKAAVRAAKTRRRRRRKHTLRGSLVDSVGQGKRLSSAPS